MATSFSKARIEKLIKESGAIRVSAKAILELDDVLGAKATDIARYAVEIASHSGRKTVKESDIKLAASKAS
ncbi:MAG: histone [Candidatus Thorarchaeota archaeon]